MKQESKLAQELNTRALASSYTSQQPQLHKTSLLISLFVPLFVVFFVFFTFGFFDILVLPQRPRHLCRLSAPQPL